MPKFMLIAAGADLDKRSGAPDFYKKMLSQYTAWIENLQKSGRLVTSFKLQDQGGLRLAIRGGEVIDGPFIETKEVVGGVFVIEAASFDEAADIARGCPNLVLQNGYMEVRAVEAYRLPTS